MKFTGLHRFPALGVLLMLTLTAPLACAGVVYEVYRVVTGDTMEAIASRFNTTTEAVRRRNGLAPDAPIYVGQSLIVPVGSRESEATTVETVVTPPSPRTPPPPPTPPPTRERVVGKLGTIVRGGGAIRSQRGRGRLYYAPPRGMQIVITQQAGDFYGVLMSNGATGWVARKYARLEGVELVSRIPSPGDGSGGSVVAEAYKFLGVPYHYGGNGAAGIDCSALVKRSYLASRGVSLPRTAAEQAMVGQLVLPHQLEPGDRIYFSRSGTRIDHCGIYLGNGQFIHASGAANRVTVNSLHESKYGSWFRLARR